MQNTPIMSVSGIRGIVGESVTPLLVSRIAFLQTQAAGKGRIVVGRDTRPSGEMLARAAFRGIRAAGGQPVDIGIAPTPTTCVAVPELGATAGIIITASHNPNPYNGYKMVHASGRLFRADECEYVYNLFRQGTFPSEEELAGIPDTPHEKTDAGAVHINRICAQVDADCIRSAGISVGIDSINGAAGAVFPRMLSALGVKWTGVNNKLDGDFTHDPEPRPEHLAELSALLQKNPGLWGGFVFDPDADRLAPMDESGRAVSEEMTLALALQNILNKKKSNVAVNLSTSMIIDDVATRYGVSVFRTKIGEANVVEGMERHNCAVGGEGNGGLIYPAVSWARDGLAALAVIIELMAVTGKKLSALAAGWPVYAMVKGKIPVKNVDPAALVAALSEKFTHEVT
ncbi:MAG: phosphoglucosamine mutase, partial [Syntrophales bacterium LBB04]|nr:phosphoglucosamine mutase [Syntrophales bacterium LBB04]